MVSVNATFFVQLLQFILLVFILNFLLIRPLMKTVRERDLKIQKTKEEISEIQQRIKGLLEGMKEQELSVIRAANHKRELMKQEAEKEALQLQEKVRQEVEERRRTLSEQIESSIATELQRVETNAAILAKEIMARLLMRGSNERV
ncbi:MAG: hypothetical protein ACK4WB_02860 [Desulfatiglandales bacterium]